MMPQEYRHILKKLEAKSKAYGRKSLKLMVDVKDDQVKQATFKAKQLEDKIKQVKIDAYSVLKTEDRDLNILLDELRRMQELQ